MVGFRVLCLVALCLLSWGWLEVRAAEEMENMDLEQQRSLYTAKQYSPQSRSVPPSTVEELDLEKYLGRWYQMYGSLSSNTTFERDGRCVTGDYYAVDKPGVAFSIVNSMTYENGSSTCVQGGAYPTQDPGKFVVLFTESSNPNNYWVVATGEPESDDGLYPWAVVSTPLMFSLYILARNVNEFRERYQDEVLELVAKKGFTRAYNRPLETYQASDCKYAPYPNPPSTVPDPPFDK